MNERGKVTLLNINMITDVISMSNSTDSPCPTPVAWQLLHVARKWLLCRARGWNL